MVDCARHAARHDAVAVRVGVQPLVASRHIHGQRGAADVTALPPNSCVAGAAAMALAAAGFTQASRTVLAAANDVLAQSGDRLVFVANLLRRKGLRSRKVLASCALRADPQLVTLRDPVTDGGSPAGLCAASRGVAPRRGASAGCVLGGCVAWVMALGLVFDETIWWVRPPLDAGRGHTKVGLHELAAAPDGDALVKAPRAVRGRRGLAPGAGAMSVVFGGC